LITGQYLGGDIEEEYKVNEAADICSDWYTARITAAVTSQVRLRYDALDFLYSKAYITLIRLY
jgi:hypothetical protein